MKSYMSFRLVPIHWIW